jgi:hypothetical protein
MPFLKIELGQDKDSVSDFELWVMQLSYVMDVEDQESRRTFEIVHAKPGLDDSGLDFEEL